MTNDNNNNNGNGAVTWTKLKKVGLPIGASAGFVVVFVPIVLAGQAWMLNMTTKIDRTDLGVSEIKEQIRQINKDFWTRRDMENWTAVLRAMNSTVITVPELPK